MKKNLWQKWIPTEGIIEGHPFMATSFYEDVLGIKVTFKIYAHGTDESRQLKIFFKSPIIFYSKIGDSLCPLPVGKVQIDHGPDHGKWRFFSIQNSNLIEQLLTDQANSSLERESLYHFMVAGVESDLNVIVTQLPEAEWITV
jgi:hypothetical protein